jgi:hypothetical protein
VILTIDTATFGSFFIAALVLFERGEGALAALTVSPLRFGEYLGAKIASLTGLSVASAVPIALAAGLNLGTALLGVGLLSVLFLVLCFALVVRQPSLTAFLTVAPLPLAPLIAAPLVHLTGVADQVTVPRYLAYRAIAVAAVALLMLTIVVPVSGLTPRLELPALVLAAEQAPLITLATAAVARNKVEGLAWLKILGLLPTGIAPAMWWLPEPVHWPLRVLPHYWTVDALWHPTLVGILVGTALTALAVSLLARQTLRRLR